MANRDENRVEISVVAVEEQGFADARQILDHITDGFITVERYSKTV